MACITIKDVYLIAASMAAAHIGNPCNNVGPYDDIGRQDALETAVKAVKEVLKKDGITIANDFQEAVLYAADVS